MDSRYRKVNRIIDIQSKSFFLYLHAFVLNNKLWDELMRVSTETNVYVFSGIIRNFLLGYLENKDLDFVVRDIHSIRISKDLCQSMRVYRNSFGGYKINYKHLVIDAWDITDTWGIVQKGVSATPQELVKTAFFNFSAIAYDLRERKFIYDIAFSKFLLTKEMDVVYPENPNIALCIVNSLYYSQKYSLSMSKRLCIWILSRANSVSLSDYVNVQIKHFGKVLFNINTISEFLISCYIRVLNK